MKLDVEKTLKLLADPNIKSLDLSQEGIHELTLDKFKALFEALTANTSLRYLNISHNYFGILPMKRLLILFTFLEQNTSIIKLNLYSNDLNKMPKEAQAKFFQCFEKNQTLIQVDARGNEFATHQTEMEQLKLYLERNKAAQHLKVVKAYLQAQSTKESNLTKTSLNFFKAEVPAESDASDTQKTATSATDLARLINLAKIEKANAHFDLNLVFKELDAATQLQEELIKIETEKYGEVKLAKKRTTFVIERDTENAPATGKVEKEKYYRVELDNEEWMDILQKLTAAASTAVKNVSLDALVQEYDTALEARLDGIRVHCKYLKTI